MGRTRLERRNVARLLGSLGTAAIVVAYLGVGSADFAAARSTASNVTVDLTTPVRSVSPNQFGLDITGYGFGNYITNDSAEQAMLNGRYGVMRMGLKYTTPGDPNSPIVANGTGADTTVTGDQWVTAIKNLGATPIVIVPENATDAANMVRHFNTGTSPNRVSLWIIGNEPDGAGETATTYSDQFNPIYDAMKAVDPTIKVGGPAVSNQNMSYIQTFLNISGSRTDFVDFHQYGEGGPTLLCDSQLLANTSQWESNVDQIRTMIQNTVPSRASGIGIQVGELNTSWSTDNNPASLSGCGNIGTQPVQYRNVATVIIASIYLHLVNAGGTGFTFGDKNGALGILYDQDNASRPSYAQNGAGLDERMPAYQGEGFFTGEAGTSLAHFGTTLVSSSTTLPNVEVAASSNPDVVVLINKGSSSQNAVVGVNGVTNAVGYQKDGSTSTYALPATLPLTVANGQIAVTLPAFSVTQLVLSNPNSLYEVQASQKSGYCLDNTNGSASKGNPIQIWTCLHNANQEWEYAPSLDGVSGDHQLQNSNGMCLDDPNDSTVSGTKVQLWTCLGDASQRWTARTVNGSYVEYVNANGLCLDNTSNAKTNGSRVQVWACNGDVAQQWYGPSPTS